MVRETRTVAIVGASANSARAAHSVWRYLESASDYALYLVNPTVDEIDGIPTFDSLAALPVARDGEAAGLNVVMDRCLKVEYARLLSVS